MASRGDRRDEDSDNDSLADFIVTRVGDGFRSGVCGDRRSLMESPHIFYWCVTASRV